MSKRARKMEIVDAGGATTYPVSPQFDCVFDATLTALNESSAVVFVSFDGVNDHGRLTPSTASAGIAYQLPGSKLWFRTAGASPSEVQVIAEQVL